MVLQSGVELDSIQLMCRLEKSKIDEGSPNSEQPFEAEDEGYELVNDCKQVSEMDGSEHEDRRDETAVVDSHSKESRGKDCHTLVVRMYFDTYDDAYNFK
ncbi:hypothetical protein KIW84_014672 [Lathyrus oleraceus]|uniref:Uncharacterized protein n=1 Tax=Pisum sativum TaxID=3888 RepID=A0A9D5GZJ5_PEA|nr:hypothetical protein KIW84_014672 [Pisum sativum]